MAKMPFPPGSFLCFLPGLFQAFLWSHKTETIYVWLSLSQIRSSWGNPSSAHWPAQTASTVAQILHQALMPYKDQISQMPDWLFLCPV